MTRRELFRHLNAILLVGAGGFVGSNLRYLVEVGVPSSLLATFAVNVLGCLALGFVLSGDAIGRSTRTFLAIGVIGSFTTYSTFVVDAIGTAPVVALGYVLGSYVLGFTAVLAGRECARRLTGSMLVSGVSD